MNENGPSNVVAAFDMLLEAIDDEIVFIRRLGARALVLEHVLQRMKNILRDVDFEPLASKPNLPSWKSNAERARYFMVQDGRLRSDSPHGLWEISDSGIRFLQEGSKS